MTGTKKASVSPVTPDDEARHQADAALYIAELSESLARMARNHNLDALGFILEMAKLEAESASRNMKRKVREPPSA